MTDYDSVAKHVQLDNNRNVSTMSILNELPILRKYRSSWYEVTAPPSGIVPAVNERASG